MARQGHRKKASGTKHLTSLDDYVPSVFLRCHNQRDNDDETKIWKCAFEPSLENPEETTNCLATCGGKTVCIIDVCTKEILKRFHDSDKNENFYTLAWTTIEVSGKKKINILAVAGEGAKVKLINPSQLLLYATIRGHRQYISCLLFHPTLSRLLFSGSRDGFVFLWDIGVPDQAQNNTYLPLLKISLQETVGDALNLVFSEHSQLLIAGAEKGCVGWRLADFSSLSPIRRRKAIEQADITFYHPQCRSLTVDGLIKLPGNLIATKQVDSGEILIWDLSRELEKQKKDVSLEPMRKLKYPQHQVKYLNMGYSNYLLGVGDDQGNLLLYNIQDILKKHPREDEESALEASIKCVINTVAISSSREHVIGGTDNNLICIWKTECIP